LGWLCAASALWLGGCPEESGLERDGGDAGMVDAADGTDSTDAGAEAADPGDAEAPDGDGEETTDGEGGDPACPDCGMIRIYVAGDPRDKTFQDGLSGQTPFDYFIGVSSYQALRGVDDPAPVLCFDYGADTFAIDLGKDNLVGRCRTSSLAPATYTHGRTKVDWMTYKVVGDVHVGALSLPATFQVFKAFSACDHDGRRYAAGEGWVGYEVAGATGQLPYDFPELPALAGVTFVTEGDAFYMVFPFTHPFVIAESDSAEHWSRMYWEIDESYRWTDLRLEGYAAGRWDVAASGTTEEVRMFGVSGYRIDSSED
jgi:hypothetical protein